MLEKMDWMLISIKNRFRNYLERLESEEDGSVMVELVVLIVIIVIVAGIFKTELSKAVTNVFGKLTTFISGE